MKCHYSNPEYNRVKQILTLIIASSGMHPTRFGINHVAIQPQPTRFFGLGTQYQANAARDQTNFQAVVQSHHVSQDARRTSKLNKVCNTRTCILCATIYQTQAFVNEAWLWFNLRHPNIHPILGIFTNPQTQRTRQHVWQ
jgi:hypothetical protein